MALISILVALALEYFFGALDRVRNYAWFDAYTLWLEKRCGGKVFWNGPLGVLLTLALPLLFLYFLAALLDRHSIILVFLLATAVFIYFLGPDLNELLDKYVTALHGGDEASASHLEETIQISGISGGGSGERIIRSILVRAHEHLFGVIFWFIILGMLGAMLYGLTVQLKKRFGDIRGGYADAIQKLHGILMWPSARLQALGFALAGDLVSGLGGWNSVPEGGQGSSEDLIGSCGIGALNYAPNGGTEEEPAKLADWVQESQALINRTLIIWLTALGFMTLGGWLA